MDEKFMSKYLEIEKDHAWFQARRDIVLRILKNIQKNIQKENKLKQPIVLEVGSAGGELIREIEKFCQYFALGVDISFIAAKKVAEKNLKSFVMRGEMLGIKDNSIDILVASDVLEHIEDDISTLKEWRRVLKEGGILIVFVPALKFLWSSHDEINHHKRRYSKKEIIQKLQNTNFEILKISYWNSFLFLPSLILRKIIPTFKKEKKDYTQKLPKPINSMVSKIMKIENSLIQKINLPIGMSLLAIARK